LLGPRWVTREEEKDLIAITKKKEYMEVKDVYQTTFNLLCAFNSQKKTIVIVPAFGKPLTSSWAVEKFKACDRLSNLLLQTL
jgi:hypothetical protein